MNRLPVCSLCPSLPLAACATTAAASPRLRAAAAAAPRPTTPARAAHDALFALFKASDEASLELNPLDALFRGDLRYADRFGDYHQRRLLSPRPAPRPSSDLAALAGDRPRPAQRRPTRSPTTPSHSSTEDALARLDPALLALTRVRPINHFSGLQTFYPTLSSGKGAAPFATLADYDNALKRHAGYVALPRRRDRALPRGHGGGRGRDQADDPQRHRPVRHAAGAEARGFGLLRPDQAIPGGDRRRRPRAAGARISGDDRRPDLSRLSPHARLSARPTICPPRATMSGCGR